MERSITFTELKQNLRAAKKAAREDVVHVLLNGRPSYVLCSFEVWERRMASAAQRGTYRANVEESIRESTQDIRDGRLIPATDVLNLNVNAEDGTRIAQSALRYLDLEYDGEQRLLLGQTLSEIAQRPSMGRTVDIEYTGADTPPSRVYRFFSPPCDILYTTNHNADVIVCGFVRSIDWSE